MFKRSAIAEKGPKEAIAWDFGEFFFLLIVFLVF